MKLEDRVNREKEAHDDTDILLESVKLKERFHHISSYPSLLNLLEMFSNPVDEMRGLNVLDYGCGKGEDAKKYLERGSIVTGIDISESYIKQARAIVEGLGFKEGTYAFKAMDAHKLELPYNHYDLVIGNGILHHLDPSIALNEIHKVLKAGGRVIFREPLADNPLLKLFRYLTPKARTVDERPFSRKDLSKILDDNMWHIDNVYYCGILEAPIAVFTSILLPKYPNNYLLKIAHKAEMYLNRIKYLHPYNQYILIDLTKKL